MRKLPVSTASLTVPAEFSFETTGISQSIFTAFMRCRQAFLYALNRWGKDKGGVTTGFGSITHEMLDRIYSNFMTRGKLPSGKMLDKWLDDYVDEHRNELRGKSEDELEKDKAVIHVLLTEYMEYYADDWSSKQWLALEELFDVRFNGVRMRGKKDGRFLIGGKVWLLETKTMSQIDEEKLLARLDLNFQNLFYIVADELQHHELVRGVLYNVVRNPGHKQVRSETLQDLQAKVREHIRREPEHFFKRFEIIYNENDKAKFRTQLEHWFNEAKDFVAGKLPVTRNFTSCDHKFPCDFIGACTGGTMAGYTQRPILFPELDATAPAALLPVGAVYRKLVRVNSARGTITSLVEAGSVDKQATNRGTYAGKRQRREV